MIAEGRTVREVFARWRLPYPCRVQREDLNVADTSIRDFPDLAVDNACWTASNAHIETARMPGLHRKNVQDQISVDNRMFR
jgi:hypothetical protein